MHGTSLWELTYFCREFLPLSTVCYTKVERSSATVQNKREELRSPVFVFSFKNIHKVHGGCKNYLPYSHEVFSKINHRCCCCFF